MNDNFEQKHIHRELAKIDLIKNALMDLTLKLSQMRSDLIEEISKVDNTNKIEITLLQEKISNLIHFCEKSENLFEKYKDEISENCILCTDDVTDIKENITNLQKFVDELNVSKKWIITIITVLWTISHGVIYFVMNYFLKK